MRKREELDTIKMTREIRERLSALYYENPEEYFRQLEESGRRFKARRKRLRKKAVV